MEKEKGTCETKDNINNRRQLDERTKRKQEEKISQVLKKNKLENKILQTTK